MGGILFPCAFILEGRELFMDWKHGSWTVHPFNAEDMSKKDKKNL